jgi:dephospho-CoA kinase
MSVRETRERAGRARSTRESNDRIAEKAKRYRFVSRVPLLCECSDPACDEIVLVDLDRYEQIRRDGYLTAPGHALAEHRQRGPAAA